MPFLSNLWGRITGRDAGETFPKQQGESLGRLGDVYSAQPYGIYANLPTGQLFKVLDEDGRVVMGVTVERPPNVEQNEVSIWHPSTGTVIHFKNNGDLNIDTAVTKSGNVNINTVDANITASGDITATAEGDVEINCVNSTVNASANANVNCVNSTIVASTKITFDTPLGQFTGALTVDGLVTAQGYAFGGGAGTVAGTANFTGAIQNNGTDIGENHGHTQANDSGGNTEVDTGGVA